jgi:predicted membrane protein
VGSYTDSKNASHGFVRAANGTITKFDPKGSGKGAYQGTYALSINTSGTIAGQYYDANNVGHGFVRAADGTITTFEYPGSGTGNSNGTYGFGINDAGVVSGNYFDANNVVHGFVRSATGTFTSFDVPGATGTVANFINASGEIQGRYYVAPSKVAEGFVRAANGKKFATFSIPGAGGTGFPIGAFPYCINAAGDVSGFYSDANNVNHGFLYAYANGMLTYPIDPTGAGTGAGQGTTVNGINTAGAISGSYTDAGNLYHGFVRAANGTITTYDVPGAGTGAYQGTGGAGINASGVITGSYTDSKNVSHGFVRTP